MKNYYSSCYQILKGIRLNSDAKCLRSTMKIISMPILLILLLYGCTATKEVCTRPEVSLPGHAKAIMIVNRTEEPALFNAVTNIISLFKSNKEVFFHVSSDACLQGLTNELRNAGFNVVNGSFNTYSKRSKNGNMLEALNWDEIAALTNGDSSVVLLVLEALSGKQNTYESSEEITPIFNKENRYVEYRATVNTDIKCSWRIYDWAEKKIIDEYRIEHYHNISYTGTSKSDLNDKLNSGKTANGEEGARGAGAKYGMRFSGSIN